MTDLTDARIATEEARQEAESERKDMHENFGCAGLALAIFLIVLSVGSCDLMDKYGKKVDAETKLIELQLKKQNDGADSSSKVP